MSKPILHHAVTCPPDRGEPGYKGQVVHVDDVLHHNHLGHPYHWVTVRHPRGTKHVWPSNRLAA